MNLLTKTSPLLRYATAVLALLLAAVFVADWWPRIVGSPHVDADEPVRCDPMRDDLGWMEWITR